MFMADNEFFFVDPDIKLSKVAPEGWKEESKKKNKPPVNFTLFFRIKFFVDDVSLIQWVYEHLFNLLSSKPMDINWIFFKPSKFLKNKSTKDGGSFMCFLFFYIYIFPSRHTLTCHQYYLQLRKDILEDRMHCDDETALLLASLALQAEYGDYQAEVHHQFHLWEIIFSFFCLVKEWTVSYCACFTVLPWTGKSDIVLLAIVVFVQSSRE